MISEGRKYLFDKYGRVNFDNISDMICNLCYITYAGIWLHVFIVDDKIETVVPISANVTLTISMFFGIFRGFISLL